MESRKSGSSSMYRMTGLPSCMFSSPWKSPTPRLAAARAKGEELSTKEAYARAARKPENAALFEELAGATK
jgi:hypothetical protein